jgi:hypothetical protein
MKIDHDLPTFDTAIKRVEKHFGGKHLTIHYADKTECNVYVDGYKSNYERVLEQTPQEIKDNMKAKSTAKKGSSRKNVARVEDTGAIDNVLTPTEVAPVTPVVSVVKVNRADVKTAVENFLANPPDKPLTLTQVYETIGFAHRQVYMMVREHGVLVGKTDATGKGRKENLFTFTK